MIQLSAIRCSCTAIFKSV